MSSEQDKKSRKRKKKSGASLLPPAYVPAVDSDDEADEPAAANTKAPAAVKQHKPASAPMQAGSKQVCRAPGARHGAAFNVVAAMPQPVSAVLCVLRKCTNMLVYLAAAFSGILRCNCRFLYSLWPSTGAALPLQRHCYATVCILLHGS